MHSKRQVMSRNSHKAAIRIISGLGGNRFLNMKFDDPEQEPPFWVATNNVVLNTPFPGIQIKAYATVKKNDVAVFLSGPRLANVAAIEKFVKRERQALLRELPDGAQILEVEDWPIYIGNFDLRSDEEKRLWIMKTINACVNVLRPRLKKWYEESCGAK